MITNIFQPLSSVSFIGVALITRSFNHNIFSGCEKSGENTDKKLGEEIDVDAALLALL